MRFSERSCAPSLSFYVRCMNRKPLFTKMVAGAFIAVLVALWLVQRLAFRAEHSRVVATRSQIDGLRTALQMYVLQCGTAPTPAQGLSALVTNFGVAGWQGP